MSDAVIIQLIVTVGGIVAVVLGNKKLNRIRADTAATREQAENEHADAEYPNLREELTATREAVVEVGGVATAALDEAKAAKGATHGLTRQLARLTSWLEDVSTGSEDTDDALDRVQAGAARALARAVKERDEKLAELRDEVPALVRDALTQHVTDCPLRTPPKETP